MADIKKSFSCSDCKTLACKNNGGTYPKFCLTAALEDEKLKKIVGIYKNNKTARKIATVSAEIEGDFYCKLTRIEETIEFIRRIKAKKVGIASCVGLMNETGMLTKIFDKYGISYYTAGCKLGAVDKGEIGISDEHKINRGCGHESMCNPIMQAEVLNGQKTDMNIIMGLCVGHDMLFSKYSKAPVTTLIVKDRVLSHNPAGALYTSGGMYSRFK